MFGVQGFVLLTLLLLVVMTNICIFQYFHIIRKLSIECTVIDMVQSKHIETAITVGCVYRF